MADPYGIASVALSGLRAAKALHNLIIDLSNAPNELLALSNEVCNLKLVLDAVGDAAKENEQNLQKLDRLGPLLFHTRVKLEKLDALMRKWSKFNRWREVRLKRMDRVYWLKERNQVWDLQKQLREIRTNLSVLLEASSLYALAFRVSCML